MTKLSESAAVGPPSGRRRSPRPFYGVDALPVPVAMGFAGAACGLGAARWPKRGAALTAVAGFLLANSGIYLHTSLRGKLSIWERELDRLALSGDEDLLDLGCGRGAVLIAAAQRLPVGRATGVDLWTKDQSGNSAAATQANAAAAGVTERVSICTGDITDLPFVDESFDVVTSALTIHNIHSPQGRLRSLDEAMRVLRPGGCLMIADLTHMAKQYAAHLGLGTLRPLGPGYWYGGPWFGVSLLQAVKPATTD